MEKTKLILAAMVFGALFGLVGGTVMAERFIEPRLSVWKVERCYTNDCVESALNRLPTASADTAKLTTWGSGVGAVTFVWYRE